MNVVLNAAAINLQAAGAPNARHSLLLLHRPKRRSRRRLHKVRPNKVRRSIGTGKGTGNHVAPSAALTR